MFCVPILQAVCLPSLIYYLSSIYLSSGVMCDYKFLSLSVYWVSPNHHLLSKFIIKATSCTPKFIIKATSCTPRPPHAPTKNNKHVYVLTNLSVSVFYFRYLFLVFKKCVLCSHFTSCLLAISYLLFIFNLFVIRGDV